MIDDSREGEVMRDEVCVVDTAILETAATDLVATGMARVRLTSEQADILARVLDEGRVFFAQPEAQKRRYENLESNSNYGYRPLGVEYAATPDRVDLNDCFCLWSDRVDLIPHADEVQPLISAMLEVREVLKAVTSGILGELAERYGGTAPAFANATNLQLNSYFDKSETRDLLQDLHEDGHLLTVVHADSPGLEFALGDEIFEATPDADEVFIMAGSVLTSLTGGDISPLYHQVRNLHLDHRLSVMYFVNPSLDVPVMQWKVAPGEEPVDVRIEAQRNPLSFGLLPIESL